jgi:CO/xanthine dehydrogenase Mo-binding subunit
LRYVAQHDCGTMVNPLIVEGQIRGGVAQGIGGGFYERIVYDEDGQPLTTSYMDFLMATALEVPSIEIGHLETPSPLNPLGIKGVGEAGAIPGPALLAEAIEDALAPFDVRIREMPLDPSRLRALIKQARLRERREP